MEASLILAAFLPQAGVAGSVGGAAPQDGEASTFAALAALAAGEPSALPPALASDEAVTRQAAKAGACAVPIPSAQPIPAGATTRIADDVVLVLAQSALPDVMTAAGGGVSEGGSGAVSGPLGFT